MEHPIFQVIDVFPFVKGRGTIIRLNIPDNFEIYIGDEFQRDGKTVRITGTESHSGKYLGLLVSGDFVPEKGQSLVHLPSRLPRRFRELIDAARDLQVATEICRSEALPESVSAPLYEAARDLFVRLVDKLK